MERIRSIQDSGNYNVRHAIQTSRMEANACLIEQREQLTKEHQKELQKLENVKDNILAECETLQRQFTCLRIGEAVLDGLGNNLTEERDAVLQARERERHAIDLDAQRAEFERLESERAAIFESKLQKIAAELEVSNKLNEQLTKATRSAELKQKQAEDVQRCFAFIVFFVSTHIPTPEPTPEQSAKANMTLLAHHLDIPLLPLG